MGSRAVAPLDDGAPLELRWHDLLGMGELGGRLAQPRCRERSNDFALRAPSRVERPLVAGRLRLGSFAFAGERIGFGFDLEVGPEEAFHGRVPGRPAFTGLEEVRWSPKLYLPEPWLQAIDAATYPALLLSGAAIGTYVLIQLLR